MAALLDLHDIAVVDNHCHPVDLEQRLDSVAHWRSRFTESPDPGMRSVVAADTAFYRRLTRAMAAFHGTAESEEAVLAARAQLSTAELTAALFQDAAIAGVVADTGFPPAATSLPGTELEAASGSQQVDLLRLELLFQDLVVAHEQLQDVLSGLHVRLDNLRSKGFAGLKSIVGYRTGLSVERWDVPDVDAAFRAARREVEQTGVVRLGHKPLLDTLLHASLAVAAEQQLPVQFHVGYGDPDVDLRRASPLELRPLLEHPAYRAVPIVLLHGCWPWFRQGSFLAAVYPNVYLDLSYAIPFLSIGEMTSMTRAALGAAPFAKLMYSSDGARVPELHWMGAHDGRRVLGRVLGELVDDGDLDTAQAYDVAQRVLARNAWQLYGLRGGPT